MGPLYLGHRRLVRGGCVALVAVKGRSQDGRQELCPGQQQGSLLLRQSRRPRCRLCNFQRSCRRHKTGVATDAESCGLWEQVRVMNGTSV